jgi:hypothetical protein
MLTLSRGLFRHKDVERIKFIDSEKPLYLLLKCYQNIDELNTVRIGQDYDIQNLYEMINANIADFYLNKKHYMKFIILVLCEVYRADYDSIEFNNVKTMCESHLMIFLGKKRIGLPDGLFNMKTDLLANVEVIQKIQQKRRLLERTSKKELITFCDENGYEVNVSKSSVNPKCVTKKRIIDSMMRRIIANTVRDTIIR